MAAFRSDIDSRGNRYFDGHDVFIESAQFEPERPVRVSAGKNDREPHACLVVRVRYPEDRPVLVHLTGVPLQGQEHRLYAEANKYTGIFWPVHDSQAKALSLGLISLEAFKKEAYTYSPDKLKLGPPTLGDDRQRIMRAPEPRP